MNRWWLWGLLLGALHVGLGASGLSAALVTVPGGVDRLEGVHEDEHLLMPAEGHKPLGRQRLRAWREDGVLHLELDRRFANGEQSREEATARIDGVLRPLSFFKKVVRGEQVELESVDFQSGRVVTVLNGQTRRYRLTLPPDTYVGPMLGVVLGQVAARPGGVGEFNTIALTPEPTVYRMRAEVVGEGRVNLGRGPEPAYEVLLKADLGPLKNILLGSLVPGHHFWFTHDEERQFLAFRGSLGYGGRDVRILPTRPQLSKGAPASPGPGQ